MDLCKAIKDLLLSEKDTPRVYVGASSIGHPCKRSVWYQAHNTIPDQLAWRTKIIFKTGHHLETMLIDLIKQSGVRVKCEQMHVCDIEYSFFSGHLDLVVNDEYVVDIKSCKNSEFNLFVKNGLKKWKPQYYDQLQSYMGMTGYKKAILLAINKDTGQLHQELIEFDELHYDVLRQRAKHIYHLPEPPERINKNATFYICQMCSYKKRCHFGGKNGH
jgi:hypothetical protein